MPYQAYLFNPSTGISYDLGIIINTLEKNPMVGIVKHEAFKKHHHLQRLIMNENPNVRPAASIPMVMIVTDGEYHLSRLPAPQDWVIVLEKAE